MTTVLFLSFKSASKAYQDLKYKAVPKVFLPITPISTKVSGIQEKLQSDK
jgi:hypothetical protein